MKKENKSKKLMRKIEKYLFEKNNNGVIKPTSIFWKGKLTSIGAKWLKGLALIS